MSSPSEDFLGPLNLADLEPVQGVLAQQSSDTALGRSTLALLAADATATVAEPSGGVQLDAAVMRQLGAQ